MKRSKKRWPNGRVVLVNHRGLSTAYPENTLAAFRNSIAMSVDVIELDLRGTKDHVPVVMHDPTVDRTTNGTGPVEALTLTQLKRLDAGSHLGKKFSKQRVPTYAEVLALVSGTGVNLLLDIKLGKSLDFLSIVDLTEKHGVTLNVIIGARTIQDVKRFRSLNANLRILGLVKNRQDIKHFLDAGADMIRVWPKWIYASPSLAKRIRRLGKPVWATANDAGPKELLRLIRLEVSGILTDRPKTLAMLMRDIDAGKISLRSG